MSIFLNKDSKVIVQGITGGEGTKHTALMLKAGTNVVGGVNARKAGTTVSHKDKDGNEVEREVAVDRDETVRSGRLLTIIETLVDSADQELLDRLAREAGAPERRREPVVDLRLVALAARQPHDSEQPVLVIGPGVDRPDDVLRARQHRTLHEGVGLPGRIGVRDRRGHPRDTAVAGVERDQRCVTPPERPEAQARRGDLGRTEPGE